jgi:hypothetical protein
MSFDPSALEADLRLLRAADLDASLLDRLDACANGTWTELSPAEIQREQQLRAISPTKLSPTLMASLEATLHNVPFAKNPSIVHFPLKQPAAQHHRRNGWAAAAAVALVGAITALLIPTNHRPNNLAITQPNKHLTTPSPAGGELVPAGFNRGLSEASDEGVIWQSNNQPHRVLKVVYKDQVTLKDAAGHTYQVEQPRVEYILVPAKTH